MTYAAVLDAVPIDFVSDVEDIIKSYPNGKIVRYRAGECVVARGQLARCFSIVVGGELQVRRSSENGTELHIHSINKGECNHIGCSSLLSGRPAIADVIAVKDCELWTIQKLEFRRLMNKSEIFRRYVYSSMESGLSQITQFLEDVTCVRIEKRLSRLLIKWRDNQNKINHTHSEIASNLGTAREVVSRNLKIFEKRGCVELHRGYIFVCNNDVLKNIAVSD